VILPNLCEQLQRAAAEPGFPGEQREKIARIVTSMTMYDKQLRQAFDRDLGERSFSRRLYLAGNKSLGEDRMVLEPQSFLLQMPDFPVERKRRLYAELDRRLLAGEVLGPREREQAFAGVLGPGIRENGGFWYALAGETIIGVATFDKSTAWQLLRRMTFHNFAEHFPDYWVGQWTGPDTLNASTAGAVEGLPTPDSLWSPFAAYCAHPHAWALYSYYRLKEGDQ
jgi:cellobiose phosphorylase